MLQTTTTGANRLLRATTRLLSFCPRSDEVIQTSHRRLAVIHDPALNRGTSFSIDERERLCLRGLVPPRQQPISQQIDRVMKTYQRQRTNLDKYQFLSMLMDRNTVLFYRILCDHFEELAPIVYTPTVGEACQKFHAIYRRTRGMYFSVEDRQHFRTMVYNWPNGDVDVIVVTDGSRVLALGDLGCNSMNIPIGKLSLYVSGAGLSPHRVLPVVLDVGTDNEELREHPLYLGLNRSRLKGDEYFAVLDEWMSAIRNRWPDVLIQFEDFATDVAEPLLNRYRNVSAPCFNDDIQSTGCVAVAAVLASLRARGRRLDSLGEEIILCAGAGSAGLGVCDALIDAMVDSGIPREKAYQRFVVVDEHGLLGVGRDTSGWSDGKSRFVRNDAPSGESLFECVKRYKPSVLLGLSGVGGLFDEKVVTEMGVHVQQPVILAMSNPSTASECTPEQAFNWTSGRAIFASGSPFKDVTIDGNLLYANQANNVYSFPGLGLAVTALRIAVVTDAMFLAGAKRLADLVDDEEITKGRLFPGVGQLREISAEVAAAVGMVAWDYGLVRREVPEDTFMNVERLKEFMTAEMWEPVYGQIVAE